MSPHTIMILYMMIICVRVLMSNYRYLQWFIHLTAGNSQELATTTPAHQCCNSPVPWSNRSKVLRHTAFEDISRHTVVSDVTFDIGTSLVSRCTGPFLLPSQIDPIRQIAVRHGVRHGTLQIAVGLVPDQLPTHHGVVGRAASKGHPTNIRGATGDFAGVPGADRDAGVLKGAELPSRQDGRVTGQQGVAARKSQLRIAVGIRGTENGRHTGISISALPTAKDSNVGMGQIPHRNIGHFGTCNLAVGFLPAELAQWVGVPIGAAGIGGVPLVGSLAVHLT